MGGTPKPPDPWATAQAQSASGQYAANQNFWNQNVNEFSPYGSKTYAQTGTAQVYDPFTKSYYDQPKYTSTVKLSPGEQAILSKNTAMRSNLGDLGVSQSARMKSMLSKDIDLTTAQKWMAPQAPGDIRQDQGQTDRKAVEDAMMERYKRYADPQNAAQNVQMAARGMDPGSQGYGTMSQAQGDQFSNATREAFLASGDESRRAQEAYNAATQQKFGMTSAWANQLNTLRQQQISEIFAKRNQDYNEMGALAGLAPINNPQFQPFQGSSVSDVPIGQYIYDDFNARSKQASDQMSGITGVASAVARRAAVGCDTVMAKLTAQDIVAALVAKGIPEHVAQGVAMNFQDESGLNTGIQEKAPAVGRGGFGLAQWTGPRRVALERFARSQGKPVDDLGTQLDYFMSENQGPEAAAWKQVMSAKTAQDAAIAFVNKWERPRADRAAARTAQYGGKGSTFGQQPPSQTVGSEPLTPAQHPPNPTVGTGGYVAPNAPATSVADATISAPGKTPGAKTDYGKAIAGALGGFGGGAAPQLGEGGQAPQLPSVAPQALPSMAIASGGASDPNYRNALAMLMQHLNSGQIWG